jgi:hypothetical protein
MIERPHGRSKVPLAGHRESVLRSELRAHVPGWALLSGEADEILEQLESSARFIRCSADIIIQGHCCPNWPESGEVTAVFPA